MQLWHVSDRADIALFEPKMPPTVHQKIDVPVVWAVADSHLENYLFPRDCPRICLRTNLQTTAEDRSRFFRGSKARIVIMIESQWEEALTDASLWLYELPATTFELSDANAGYYISKHPVKPLSVRPVESPIDTLHKRGVELRIVPRFRRMAHLVAQSTLAFSIIRLRNALPDM